MKKVLSLVTIAAIAALVACGPSAEEKAAMEKAKQDSIAAVEAAKAEAEAARAQATADSLAAVEAAKAAAAAATADSIAKAEEAAKGKKGAPKKTIEQKTKEEAKKATSGRG